MIQSYILNLIHELRNNINQLIDYKWNNHPFGKSPHASREDYLNLFQSVINKKYPQIDSLEEQCGFAIDKKWIDDLALHTQIVIKKSPINYSHGRAIYSLLRKMISDKNLDFVNILETGTARGFSSLCMAKALSDSQCDGRIITIDVLPHLKSQIWNCIDDLDGSKSRAEILKPWSKLLNKIIFLQGDTIYTLPRIGIDRIHFAFLDAQHSKKNVLQEFNIIQKTQKIGDMIFFDDVTENLFPGVVEAIKIIKQNQHYKVNDLIVSKTRAYSWATRIR